MSAFISRIVKVHLRRSRVVLRSLHRKYSSALYMTGDEAKESFSVITPHIDGDVRFKEISSLKDNIDRRGLKMDVEKVQSLWNALRRVEKDKMILESRRIEIANKIKQIRGVNADSKEIDGLKLQGKLLRDDLKTTTKAVWELEKKAIPKILSLPNDLHTRTPNSDLEVIFQYGEEPALKTVESHLEIGKRLGILDYISPEWYYLKGQGAIFELGILDYFANEITNRNFIKFCNSDFCRSVVVEGCGLDHENPAETFILEDRDEILDIKDVNRLHLVGGASLVSFSAFHAKQIVPASSLPLRLVAMGRHYTPDNQDQNGNNLFGLFRVCQSSSVGLFVSATDDKSELDEFDRCVTMITEIYKKLEYPFRIVYLPAKDLKQYESLRASIQMYSLHFGSYVEVGHVSMYGSYISKRLLMRYEARELKFTHIVSGTAVSVPKLLGCLLEKHHDVNDFVDIHVPDEVKKYLS